jgi:hypothetical protein
MQDTFDRAELGLGLLILAFIFLELYIELADDDEVRVLRRHKLVVPSREVGHFDNQAFHIRAQLLNDLVVGLSWSQYM